MFFFACCSVQCAAQVKEGLPVAERERRQVTGVARIRAHRRCTHSTKLRGCTQTQGDVHSPQQRAPRECTLSRKLGGCTAQSPQQRAPSSRDAHTAEELHKAHSCVLFAVGCVHLKGCSEAHTGHRRCRRLQTRQEMHTQ